MSAFEPRTDARAAATLGSLQLVVVAAWAVFVVVSLATGRTRFFATQLAAALVTLTLFVVTRRWPRTWRASMHATAAASCVAMVVDSWHAGGATAPAWWNLAVAPLFAAHVGGRRAGWAWAGLAVVGVALACLASPFEPAVEPTDVDRLLSGLALVAVTTAFGMLSRRVADQHVAEVMRAARQRGELLATIGHEVRTPLHGMLGTASLLADSGLGPEQREMIRTLKASGAALKQIVDDVLDVARLEAGQLRIEPHEACLMSVVEDVIDLFAPDAAQKNLVLVATVENPDGMRVEADASRVRQILANLVSNAVKFTTEGHVAVRAEARNDGPRVRVAISVEDTGPGIPGAKVEQLFTAFEQPDPRLARLHGGSGLGLSLARHLAERMGGTLTVDPRREEGARFTFAVTLPRRPLSAPPDLLPSPVMLLQRDPLRQAAFASTARALGVRPALATTLEEARAIAVEERPFVTVISGVSEKDPEACREVLRSALGADRPIVLGVPHDQVGEYLGTEIARSFDGTTLEPLRRSRLRALIDEASLARASMPTPLLVGKAVVIDDDATSRRLMEVMLTRRGFVVAACADGEAALRELQKDRFALVMCDLNMPSMDGIEVLRRARELDTTDRTVFVIASASAREEDRRRCLDAGFSGYLTKPFEPAQLDEVIARTRRRTQMAAPPSDTEPELDEPSIDEKVVARMRELLGEETDELLRELWDNTTTLLAGVERAPTDRTMVQRAAHTIASGALQAGLSALGERARALEVEVDARSEEEVLDEASTLYAILERSFRELGVSPAGDSDAPPERQLTRVRFVGHLGEEAVARELARASRSGAGHDRALVDCAGMTSYDPQASKAFEAWAKRDGLSAVAVVTRNRLWGSVVRAMGARSGTAMRAFWSVSEAEAWLAEGASDTADGA